MQRTRPSSKNDGFILVVAWLMVVLTVTLSMAATSRSMGDLLVANRTLALQGTFPRAEAALDFAVADLANGGCDAPRKTMQILGPPITTCTFPPVPPIPGGTSTIAGTRLSAVPEIWQLTGTGTQGGVTRQLRYVVQLTGLNVYQFAVFGATGVDVTSGVNGAVLLTSSYDSTVGTYGEIVDGRPNITSYGNVGTNSGTIAFFDNNAAYDTDIKGVLSSTSGDPSTVTVLGSQAPYVNGEKYPTAGVTQLVPTTLTLPDIASCPPTGSLMMDGSNDSGYFLNGVLTPWDAPSTHTAYLPAGGLCIDSLEVANGAKLLLPPSFPADQTYDIKITGNALLRNSAYIGLVPPVGCCLAPDELDQANAGHAQIQLLFPDPSSTFEVKGDVGIPYAIGLLKVYGKSLNMFLRERGALFGAYVAGGTVTVDTGAVVVHDTALRTGPGPPTGKNLVTGLGWVDSP